MAKRDNNHKTGSKGEWWARGTFENEGYACSAIDPDYGEDFFVFYESDGIMDELWSNIKTILLQFRIYNKAQCSGYTKITFDRIVKMTIFRLSNLRSVDLSKLRNWTKITGLVQKWVDTPQLRKTGEDILFRMMNSFNNKLC